MTSFPPLPVQEVDEMIRDHLQNPIIIWRLPPPWTDYATAYDTKRGDDATDLTRAVGALELKRTEEGYPFTVLDSRRLLSSRLLSVLREVMRRTGRNLVITDL